MNFGACIVNVSVARRGPSDSRRDLSANSGFRDLGSHRIANPRFAALRSKQALFFAFDDENRAIGN
jgi:hypothetical protein